MSEHSYKTYFKENFEVVCKFKGKQLEGVEYAPLFPYFADKAEKGAFKVILGDHVTVDTGTGLVHTAPAFGEEDFYAAKAAGIDPVCPVDTNGLFTDAIPEYKGQFVKEADKDICRRLKAEGRLIYQGTIHHSYPFCWRTNTPLIYRATTSWFVKVESIKDKILKANEQIHWTPGHIKDGRFGKWLAGARDWAISRSRYWGTPIPIWRSEDGDCHIIGSVEELEELTHQKITDLHRHFIDQLTFVKNGKVYRRIPEVFDCWFESGSVPYAQGHYPFEDKEGFEKGFPADFIAEGLDQTRGWFYTLTILAAALFDKPAFKNCIVNGILLAEDGNKMSKSLRNFTDPSITVDRYGADAIRLYMLSSPAVKADDLRFSEKGVELVLRQVLIPLWSAFDGFFNSYARIYKWTPKDFVHSDVVMDKWILSRVQKLIHDVDEGMKVYDLSIAVEPYTRFVDDLTNWYVRRSRRRFWSDENPQDRSKAFSTLYTVLVQLSKIAAPFIPFATESIFMHLRKDSDPQSVHLCDFPHYDAKARDVALERRMAQVQEVASLGHALRKEHKLKVRQPLPAVHVVSASQEVLHFLRQEQALLADELNVHQVIFHADETEFVETRINPKFSALGKKVGKHMRGLQAAFKELSSQHKASLLSGHAIHLVIEDQQFEITPQEVEVQRSVKPGLVAATEGQVTIVLDTSLTEELLLEGLARELINKISAERKEQNLAYTDRIKVTIDGSERLKHAYTLHKAYIDEEVLAKEVSFGPVTGVAAQLNDEMASLAVAKV